MNDHEPAEATQQQPAIADDLAVARRAGEAMYANDLAAQNLGIVLQDIGPGYARMGMTVREDMLNGHTTCHGGYIFVLGDTAFAFACNSYNRTTVAASAAIEFLAPAYLNDVLTVVAQEQVRGARLGIYDAAITNQNGQRIALFRGRSYRVQGTLFPDETSGAQSNTRSQP